MNKQKLIDLLEKALPDTLKDGTFADEDYLYAVGLYEAQDIITRSLEGYEVVPRERLEKIAGFWDVTMRATDNDMARLMYDASCIAKGMLSIAEEAE